MARSLVWFLTLASAGLLLTPSALANEPAAQTAAEVDSPTLDELPSEQRQAAIEQWIAQLDSARFTDRQDARRKLSAAGRQALPALEKAVLDDTSREVGASSIGLIEKLFKSNGPDLQAEAEQALQRIASAEANPNAALATRIMKGPDPSEYIHLSTLAQRNALKRMQGRGNARMFQIGGRIGGGRVQVMRMNVQNAGGVRTIEVQENGRKVAIKEDAKNGIEMSVTETINGQEKTQSYTAKSAEELKQNHPEAERIYQKYAKNGVIPGLPGR